MKYLVLLVSILIASPAWSAILVMSPSGTYTQKATLYKAATDADTAGKTVVVTSALSAVQSNISSATVHSWPSDRALKVEKGGGINPTTKFVLGSSIPIIPVEWFYDGAGNWATAINRAIQAAGVFQTVRLPSGTLPIAATTATECILYNRMVHLVGSGMNSTILEVDSTVGAGVDVIRVSPVTTDGDASGRYAYLADFKIAPKSGTPAKNGIYLDTMVAAQILDNLIIERVSVRALGGYGIYQDSHATDPDTMFNSVIRNCIIYNGIYLNRAGDTNRIENNEIRGAHYGLYVDLVSGANQFNITGNVMVATGGGIYVKNSGMLNISGNQFEQQAAFTESDKSLIVLKGTTADIYNTVIEKNTFNLNGTFDATAAIITVDKAKGTIIRDNLLNLGQITQTAIRLSANCYGANVGENYIYTGPAFSEWRIAMRSTVYIGDAGYGTVGVYKTPTLLNSWVTIAGQIAPSYMKTDLNTLVMSGEIAPGTLTAGTVLFTLPAGYRPELYLSIQTFAADSVAPLKAPAYLNYDPNTGNISLSSTLTATTTKISLNNIVLRMFYY